MFAKVGRDPVPGGASDPRADFLDRGHQRVAEYRPDDAEPELGAGLGIGRNAARIVVGCACDKVGTEHVEQARLRGADDRSGFSESLTSEVIGCPAPAPLRPAVCPGSAKGGDPVAGKNSGRLWRRQDRKLRTAKGPRS